MENTVFWVCAAVAATGMAVYLLQIAAVRAKLGRMPKNRQSLDFSDLSSFFPISVIKPLKGLDDNLFDNLASFCTQRYPVYEVIFALQDRNDPAYRVAVMVRDRFPDCDITVHVACCREGLNPKVNNLMPACGIAKYEHILISDSNVLVGDDYLVYTALPMRNDNVGLVTNIIRGTGARSVGSLLENLHLNSFIVGSVCFLDRFLRMPCVIGKSMLLKKSDIRVIGGLTAVKDVLAEDYLIGKLLHDNGRKIVLSGYAINNVNEYWSIGRFLNRHTRWGKLRWQIGGVKYLSELVGNAVFVSFLPMLLTGLSVQTAALAVAVSAVKIFGDLYLGLLMGAGIPCTSYLLVPIKDLLIGLVWFVPLFSTTVVWRGNRYIIGENSALAPCPETGIQSWRNRIAGMIKAGIAVAAK